MKTDKLLGIEKPCGQTPLELATMADMAMEIGTRERGQPAILIYDHGDGRWPCRLGPGVSNAVLRKMAKILASVAEQRREIDAGRASDDPVVSLPWGRLRKVRDWSGKRDRVLAERQFEILLDRKGHAESWRWTAVHFAIGWAVGCAVMKLVFMLMG